MHRRCLTYRLPATPGEPDTVQVVARTYRYADVCLVRDGAEPSRIGLVRLAEGSWSWEHSDGEQSSPIAPTRSAAARALAEYHRRHKPRRRYGSVRRRLGVGFTR